MAFDWTLTTSFEINGFRTSSFDAKESNQDEQLKQLDHLRNVVEAVGNLRRHMFKVS